MDLHDLLESPRHWQIDDLHGTVLRDALLGSDPDRHDNLPHVVGQKKRRFPHCVPECWYDIRDFQIFFGGMTDFQVVWTLKNTNECSTKYESEKHRESTTGVEPTFTLKLTENVRKSEESASVDTERTLYGQPDQTAEITTNWR